jgi:membrane-associated protein
MTNFLLFLQENIHLAPYLIFCLLLLAGLNLPVSEDVMLFISSVLAKEFPQYHYQLFGAVFLGAYFSDLICFLMGWKIGPKILKISFFKSIVSDDLRETISKFYERYGVWTLIVGRFIPFGVRNGLFLTAGLGKMNPLNFALSDLLACSISCVTFFSLYYKFGKEMIEYVRQGNLIIFFLAATTIVFIVIKKKRKSA